MDQRQNQEKMKKMFDEQKKEMFDILNELKTENMKLNATKKKLLMVESKPVVYFFNNNEFAEEDANESLNDLDLDNVSEKDLNQLVCKYFKLYKEKNIQRDKYYDDKINELRKDNLILKDKISDFESLKKSINMVIGEPQGTLNSMESNKSDDDEQDDYFIISKEKK